MHNAATNPAYAIIIIKLCELCMHHPMVSDASHKLVNMDDAVDFGDEPEAGEEADGTCEQEDDEGHDECVAKEEESVEKAFHLQLRDIVVDAVQEEVEGRETARQERSPPPVVVLST